MSDPRYDRRFQRGGDEGADDSVGVGAEPAASTVRTEDATRPRHRRLALLWVLAAALTLGGIAALLLVGAVELAPTSDPITFYALPALLAGVAPWLVGSGLAAAVGAVIVHVVERRRHRAAVPALAGRWPGRVVRLLLAGGGIVAAFGLALAAWRVIAYLEAGRAVSSTSGFAVFRMGGELVQYPPYVATTEPVIVGLGIALLALAVVVAALDYRADARSSSAVRDSTADSNADAHTR